MSVIALIPARGGSKGIPGKNVRALGGKPLLAWSIASARAAGVVERIAVSTEAPLIAGIAREYRAEVLDRPAELAQDDTPMLDVVNHALEALKTVASDIVVLLQPTVPFRSNHSIMAAIKALKDDGYDSALTVTRIPDRYHPDWEISRLQTFPTRRQDLRPAWVRDGAVYAFYARTIREYGNFYGRLVCFLETDGPPPVNLDTEQDWLEAERQVATKERPHAVV